MTSMTTAEPHGTTTNPQSVEGSAHEHAARDLGTRWALEVRRTLRLEKRRAAGGWPGTKREAHARAAWLLASLQPERLEGSFNTTTVTNLATTVYASAKSTWLANAEEEDEDK